MMVNQIRDRGGTRSGTDRRSRQIIYAKLDRRSGKDRRSGNDRRDGTGRYRYIERRDALRK